MDSYSRAVRRITLQLNRWPDQITRKQMEKYFTSLVESHSWSTVTVDRNGLLQERRQVATCFKRLITISVSRRLQ
ncbi:MAG: phage integrase N-terminal SAM-like domain-containing protein [Pseudomonadales bacterium]|nr:phage integrase N-terminal SAM-like domain-containing protein [Pseudomonadales bacterium]